MSTKFFLYTFLVMVLLISGSFIQSAEASSPCEIATDICMEKCNEWFQGDTIIDGAQRGACRTGCMAGYLWCLALE